MNPKYYEKYDILKDLVTIREALNNLSISCSKKNLKVMTELEITTDNLLEFWMDKNVR